MRSDRAQQIIDYLSTGAEPTQEELRQHLGLESTRHVRNLLSELRDEGVPIGERRNGRYKHYYLPEDARQAELRDVRLSERQIEALTVAVAAAKATLAPTPYREPLESAFEELKAGWVQDVFTFEPELEETHWDFGQAPNQPFEEEVFRTIVDAIRSCRSVRIDYYTASRRAWSTDRKIDPYLLAVRAGSWLIAAYCHRRHDIVDFSLAGIQEARPCDPAAETAYFAVDPDFDACLHLRDRFGAMAGETVHTVRLLIEPDRADYFRRKAYHPTQQIEERRDDGRIVVSFEVEGLDGIASFVRSWGSGVTVLEPSELAEHIAREAREVARRYEDVRPMQEVLA